MKKLLLPMLIAAALAGCSAFPENHEHVPVAKDVRDELVDQWSSTPAITTVASNAGVSVRKFNDLPERVRSKPLHLKLEDGQALSIPDLVTALRMQGVRVASSLKETVAGELTSSFDGELGSLLDVLAAEHNIAYEFRNDVLFLTEAGRYVVSLPQHEEFLKQVATAVSEMGGTAVRSDVRAGRLYYSAKPDVAQYLEEYIGNIAKNSAMVNLQVAVITVRLTRDVNLGLDWSKLAVGGGKGALAPGVTPIGGSTGTSTGGTTTGGTGGTGSTGGTGGTSGSTGGVTTGTTGAAAAAAVKLGQVLAFTGGSGAAYTFANNNFSLTAAINALSTYGNARTEQNVIANTLSGLPVKIGQGNEIPYVKSIGSTTASGGATSGSSQTDVVKSGLTLNITPHFEADDSSVVTTMKVDMSSLVGFRELSAGQNLGTMSQPEMQKLEFENVGRLQVGETMVVGGITYDQLNNSYTNLPGMEKYNTGSKSEKTNRFAVYVVVRPTVILFEVPPVAAKAVVPVPVPAAAVQPALPVVAPQPAMPAEVAPAPAAPAPLKRAPTRPTSRPAPAATPQAGAAADDQAAAALLASRHLRAKAKALHVDPSAPAGAASAALAAAEAAAEVAQRLQTQGAH